MKTIIIIAIASIAACKSDPAPTAGVTGPTAAPTSGFSAGTAAPRSAYGPNGTATSAQPVAGSDCRAAAKRLIDMGGTTKSADQYASDCEREPWSPALRGCIVAATTTDVLLKCAKVAFDGVPVQFTPKRTYELGSPEMSQATPAILTQEGDEVAFSVNGKRCGMIIANSGPASAAFVICNGAVLAGPLVEEQELRDAVTMITEAVVGEQAAQIAGQMQATHDMTMGIMSRLPHGGGTYRVYDRSTGQALYDTY